MAALNFPATPTNGQQYNLNGVYYTYNSAMGAWLTTFLSKEFNANTQNTQIYFNDAGVSNGSYALTYNKGANKLTFTGNLNLSDANTNSRTYIGWNTTSDYSTGAGLKIINLDNSSFFIGTNSLPVITGTTAGYVGIGTTSPTRKLHVVGDTQLGNHYLNDSSIELNNNGTGNRYAYIDFHGDDTYTDYGLRLIRDNGGLNAGSTLYHRGTGALGLVAQEAAPIGLYTTNTLRFYVTAGGNVGIGGITTPAYTLQVNGSFAATTKSFVIDHPSKPGMKLRHGSLEGPENGVYVRGRLTNQHHIQFPDYWKDLVDIDTITVQLTPIGKSKQPSVGDITEHGVNVLGKNIDCYYYILAERKDVDKMIVEFDA